MRSNRLLLVAFLTLSAFACGDDDTPTPDAPVSGGPDADLTPQPDAAAGPVTVSSCTGLTPVVTITNSGTADFSPAGGDATIAVGDVVEFEPNGAPHNMLS